MGKFEKNHWLDFCRAIAILMVLLSHGRGYLVTIWQPFNGLKFGGFVGVELFFALSGFLIGKIIIEKSGHSKTNLSWIPSFWFRRWARTYPVYLIFLIVNIIISGSIRPAQLDTIFSYFIFTQSLSSPHPFFFGEAWSLAIEEIFYFFTPVIYVVFYMFCKNHKKSLFLSLIAMIVLPTVYRFYLSFYSGYSLNEIRTISLARLDSIMYGVLFAWLFYFKPNHRNKLLYISKALALFFPFLAFLAHFPDDMLDRYNITKAVLFNGSGIICASFIVVGFNLNINKYLLYVIRKLAGGSYIAYLINLPILYSMHYFIPTQESAVTSFLLWATFLFITLSLSIALHESLEKKLLLLRDKISAR